MQFLFLLPIALGVLAVPATAQPYVRTVLNLTDGTFLENIHATSDGKLLLTSLTTTSLLITDPNASSPQVSSLFTVNDPNVNCLTGIDEYGPGKFAINALNLNRTIFTSYHASVWKFVYSNSSTVTPQKIVDLPTNQIVLANGLTSRPACAVANNCNTVFIANSAGSVHYVNVNTGANGVAITDADANNTLSPGTGAVPLGINGLHILGQYLYYLSSGRGLAARVPIHINGTVNGPVEILATMPAGQRGYDDFALDLQGRMWIASHPNSLDVVFMENGTWRQVVVPTGLPATALGPTSCAFGRGSFRERNTLYMTTADGILLAFDTIEVARQFF